MVKGLSLFGSILFLCSVLVVSRSGIDIRCWSTFAVGMVLVRSLCSLVRNLYHCTSIWG